MSTTPGPWRIAESDYGDEELHYLPDRILGADGSEVVGRADGLAVEGASETRIRANARLIAAAPDLLEALQRISALIRRHGVHVRADALQAIADTAVARATGEPS